MLKRILDITSTINGTVTVIPITEAAGMIEGATTIMDAEDGMRAEGLIMMTGIIRLGIPTDPTMIAGVMIDHTITVPTGGGFWVADCPWSS